MVITMLNIGRMTSADNLRRIWIPAGEHISLGHAIITPVVDLQDGLYRPIIELRSARDKCRYDPYRLGVIDIQRWTKLLLIPRALKLDEETRPVAFFLEFVRLSNAVSWAI